MDVLAIGDIEKRKGAEALLIPFYEGVKTPRAAAPLGSLADALRAGLSSKDFSGKRGETLLLYPEKGKESRLLLVGLGKEGELSTDTLRQEYAGATRKLKRLSQLNVAVPNVAELRHFSLEDAVRAIVEGVLLADYHWTLETEKSDRKALTSLTLVGLDPKFISHAKRSKEVCEGVCLTRDLINGNSYEVSPDYLAKVGKELARRFDSVETTVFDEKRILREKMHLLYAVGKGSKRPPRFIQVCYRGAPRSKDHTLLVGKGVTFDTGGTNLKPTGAIETMRGDMGGGATVLGTIAAVAALNLKLNVTALVPSAENAIGSDSYKPGDVYTSYHGKTVEIGNTDAEGRLILADALAYGVKNLEPTRVVDVATLTGAVVVALGEGLSGLFSNHDDLADQLLQSSKATSELLWRLPLHASYRELLKSEIADVRNVAGRAGGAIFAALFLESFVDEVPWAHLDIAGTSFSTKEKGTTPKNGVGFGVRLLVDWLENLEKRDA